MSEEPLLLPAPNGAGGHDLDGCENADPAAADHSPQTGGGGGDDRADRAADGRHARAGRQRPGGRSKQHTFPSEQQCLAALGKLPGLIALGLLTPGRANSIKATFAEILRWHRSAKGGPDRRRVADADLLQMLRVNPELLGLLEPLLTDDQIEMVMREAGLDGHE